jgi:hypothetical protein
VNVLIVLSGFKESLSAEEVADCIEEIDWLTAFAISVSIKKRLTQKFCLGHGET